MANWDKLNQEFDNLLENISDQEWETWAQNREQKKIVRRLQLELKAKIQLCKIELDAFFTECQINENAPIVDSDDLLIDFDFSTKRLIAQKSLDNYTPPIAA
jgi:hypothetical protein